MSLLSGVGTRLSLALLVVVAAALGVVYLVVVPSLEDRLVGSRMTQLEQAAPSLAQRIPPNRFLWPDFIETAEASTNARVVMYEILQPPLALVVVGDSRTVSSADVDQDAIALRAATTLRPASGTVTRKGQRFAEAAAVSSTGTVLLLTSSLGEALSNVHLVRQRLLLAGGLALIVALFVGYGGASLFARRIRRLERAAGRIASGSFDEPIVDRASDELGELARAFDRMRERLAQLDHARREFIANASHELRTPLFSLGGFMELLMDEELDEATRREFLETMAEQLERLTKLATELLDLSRLDAGRLSVELEPVQLRSIAETLTKEFAGVARAEGRPLEVVGGGEAVAQADEQRVIQIGRALIENAFVHTPTGTPVRLYVAARDGRAELAVEDEGGGIESVHAPHVFQRFYRVDGKRASGSGLGLAIARELAQLMGGSLTVESSPGRTVFTLRLPAQKAE